MAAYKKHYLIFLVLCATCRPLSAEPSPKRQNRIEEIKKLGKKIQAPIQKSYVAAKNSRYLDKIILIVAAWVLNWYIFYRLYQNRFIVPEHNRKDLISIYLSIKSFVTNILYCITMVYLLQYFGIDMSWTLWIFKNHISRNILIICLIIYIFRILWILNRYLFGLFGNMVASQNQADSHKIITTYEIFRNICSVLLCVFLLVAIWTVLFGNESAAILQMIGLLTGGLSIAAQNTVMDLINGMIILQTNTLKIGDWIEFDDKTAAVEEMSLRHIRIRFDDGTLVTIPFHKLIIIKNKTNLYSYVVYNTSFDIAIAVEEAQKIVKEAFEALARSEDGWRVYKDKFEMRGIADLTAFSYVLQFSICGQPKSQFIIQRLFNQILLDTFKAKNINHFIARPMVANTICVPSLRTAEKFPDR